MSPKWGTVRTCAPPPRADRIANNTRGTLDCRPVPGVEQGPGVHGAGVIRSTLRLVEGIAIVPGVTVAHSLDHLQSLGPMPVVEQKDGKLVLEAGHAFSPVGQRNLRSAPFRIPAHDGSLLVAVRVASHVVVRVAEVLL